MYISVIVYKVFRKEYIGIGHGHDGILSADRNVSLKKNNGITGIFGIMTG